MKSSTDKLPRNLTLASAVYKEWYPFHTLFNRNKVVYHPAQLDNVDALVLWGGEDISPSIYGQSPLKERYSGPANPSVRDTTERNLAMGAIEKGIPIIGICRGAQMMCALSGGQLYQHVTGHTGRIHTLVTNDGREIEGNSLHHQMMDLKNVEHELLAWVPEPLSTMYLQADKDMPGPAKEPEAAWLPKVKAICIQGHPEYLDPENPFTKYCLELVEKYCLK